MTPTFYSAETPFGLTKQVKPEMLIDAIIAMQWLHTLMACLWVGMLAARLFGAPRSWASRWLMNVAAVLTIASGVIRGTWLGVMEKPADLLDTPYGRAWTLGLVFSLALLGLSWRVESDRKPWYAMPLALVLLAAILFCMVSMQFGWRR